MEDVAQEISHYFKGVNHRLIEGFVRHYTIGTTNLSGCTFKYEFREGKESVKFSSSTKQLKT